MSDSKKTTYSNMLLVSRPWGGAGSFGLIPSTSDCPYVECIYDPENKALAVIGISKKEKFQMVPRLDDAGRGIVNKSGGQEHPMKMQRITQESFSEYYIVDKKEIKSFIEMFAVNAKDINYEKILNAKSMEKADTKSKIILDK